MANGNDNDENNKGFLSDYGGCITFFGFIGILYIISRTDIGAKILGIVSVVFLIGMFLAAIFIRHK